MKRVLHPKNLIKDFGPKNPLTRQAIHALYHALDRGRHQAVRDRFDQWQFFFSRTTDYQTLMNRVAEKPAFKNYIRQFHLDPDTCNPAKFACALQTYYAFLIKMLAILVVSPLRKKKSALIVELAQKEGGKLQVALAQMEHGKMFLDLGIRCFWEDDFFHWYVMAWDDEVEASIGAIVRRFAYYNSECLQTAPEEGRDLLKKLYHRLIPREIRYYFGEYYTPDWLAEHLLRKTLGNDLGNPNQRVLDPSCGSGTFLVALIQHFRRRAEREGWSADTTLATILNNVVGYDLNPLAVLAARANYLFALGDLLHHRGKSIEIPVCLNDSLQPRTPADGETHPAYRPNSFHYVIGNPPWVNWEHLPEAYRRATIPLWQHYGLFPKRDKGMETILGGAKYDFSMLMTCIALDRYLTTDGKLGFVITESLFKTTEAGQGFRRFTLPDDTPFKPVLVENMVDLKPFEKALNRTAIAVFQKGQKPSFPVPYTYWSKTATVNRVRIDFDADYDAFPYEKLIIHDWEAQPVDRNNLTSIWITGRPNAIKAIPRLLGQSAYSAREGVNTGGANGVYWVREETQADNGLVRIANLPQCSKKTVKPCATELETDLLYPLLRAGNVKRWKAQPDSRIILTHESHSHLRAIPEQEMQKQYPNTYQYLSQFEDFLRGRKTQVVRNLMSRGPFYSVFGIGEYSFAPWKVVWTRIAKVEAAVAGRLDDKPMIPQETLTMVNCQSEEEAHFLAATINSTPFQFTVNAYSQRGGKSMGSKHILKYVNIPRFDDTNPTHIHLAEYSKQAHNLTQNQDIANIPAIEEKIDQHAAELWNLTEFELEEIRQSYVEW